METPSPVKRKATIDLTRSDSEDNAPKRRRRVIEIESDDDEAAEAPAPAPTMPYNADRGSDRDLKKLLFLTPSFCRIALLGPRTNRRPLERLSTERLSCKPSM